MISKNKNNINENTGKVNIVDNLQVEKKNYNYDKYQEDDFIPNDYHWTNIEEQKIKAKEIEEKTK